MTNCKKALGRSTRGAGLIISETVILIVNSGVATYTLLVAKIIQNNIDKLAQVEDKRKEFYAKTIEGFELVKKK